jgi:hypothetical protein
VYASGNTGTASGELSREDIAGLVASRRNAAAKDFVRRGALDQLLREEERHRWGYHADVEATNWLAHFTGFNNTVTYILLKVHQI